VEASLQEQLIIEQGRKISPEQLREIREVFTYFDKGQDGALNKEEFWSCCTGIGLVLTEEEVRAPHAGHRLGWMPECEMRKHRGNTVMNVCRSVKHVDTVVRR
jgi:hypothetical protein